MIGAIAGDIIGSIYEHRRIKTKDFPLFDEGCTFTDDTVCTLAVAECLMEGGDLAGYLRRYVRAYPHAGYGGSFKRWGMRDDLPAYGSYGNGSAMRVSPVAYVAQNEDEVLELARDTAIVTHGHPDAISGAQATALAIRFAREGLSKEDLRDKISESFGYDLSESVAEIRDYYEFDVTCSGTVPPAIVCALEADSFEEAVRNAVSLGGDSDTLACIAGSIAEALFGIPGDIGDRAMGYLDTSLQDVVFRFQEKYVSISGSTE